MNIGIAIVVVLVVLAVIGAFAFRAVQDRRRRQERIEAAERAEHEQVQAHEQAARARLDRADGLRAGSDRQGGGPDAQAEGGWHGPSASGGFRAVDPDRRDTPPSGAASEPAVPSQRTGEHDRDQRESARRGTQRTRPRHL